MIGLLGVLLLWQAGQAKAWVVRERSTTSPWKS